MSIFQSLVDGIYQKAGMAEPKKPQTKSIVDTAKSMLSTGAGVAKTFALGTAGSNSEKDIDYGEGPAPKPKTPAVPKRWFKDEFRSMPSYKEGTDYVPETGPALLHEGEKVVSKEKNMPEKDPIKRVTSALGSLGSSVQPQEGEAAALAEKNRMIDEYKTATQSPASQPKPSPATESKPAPSPGAKGKNSYGTRKGEKRIDVKDMVKPLPSYQDGIESVPETGAAMLHEGEKVVPESKNPDSHKAKSRMNKSMSGGKKLGAKKGSKKTVHHVTVHKSANGGVILQHEFDDGSKSEMHHHSDFDEAAAAMKPHFQSPEEAPTQGEPDAGVASPASFADGGVVQKSGKADVHEGEVVVPKDQAHKVLQNPDITIGGGAKGTQQKKAPAKPRMTPELGKKMKDFDEKGWRVDGDDQPRVPNKI